MQMLTNSPAAHSRRRLFQIAAAAFLSSSLAGAAGGALAAGASVPIDQLMAAGALPDLSIGKSDAPVTIVEYASMTCSHCAAFYATTFPVLKSKYIDSGKVRFILREFPLDPLATAGFMLARCAGDDKRDAIVDLLFAQQKNWAFTDKPVESLANARKAGGHRTGRPSGPASRTRNLYDKINKVRDRASEKFGVNATPTFSVNGQKQTRRDDAGSARQTAGAAAQKLKRDTEGRRFAFKKCAAASPETDRRLRSPGGASRFVR